MFRKMIAALLVLSVLCPSVPLFAHAAQAESPEQEAQSAEEETSEVSAREDSAQTPKDYMLGASTGAETVAPPATRTVSNGTCGENLTWTLDTDSGVLTISGSGAMTDFSENSAPWYTKRSYIKTVVVEEGVTTLGVYAFRYCTALTSIALPSSLQQINALCFQSCKTLSELCLPEGLTTIDYAAFNLSGLTAIHLPATLMSLGEMAFYGCTSLNEITVAEGNTAFIVQDGVLYNSDITQLYLCPADRTEPLVIPDTVTYLGDEGLANCTKLTGLTIPDNLRWSSNALSFCNGLLNLHVYDSNPKYAEVDGVLFSKDLLTLVQFPCGRTGSYAIPDGTVTVGYAAFGRMENPMIVTMPDTVEVISGSAFSYSTGLTQLTLSGKLREIYAHAFNGCEQMENVVLPETLTSLGYDSFNGCLHITEITIPSQITSISMSTFTFCTRLEKVVLEGPVTAIGSYAFAWCVSLESINFPEELTMIGTEAFSHCRELKEARLPSALNDLGDRVFLHCEALTQIVLPQGVEVVPYGAFWDCYALTEVILPKGLRTIESSAFAETAIAGIVIPETVTEIGNSAFYKCTQLSSVHFLGDAPEVTGEPFSSCADTLVLYYTENAQDWSSPTWNELPTALWSYTFSTTADCVNGGTETFRCNECDLLYTRGVRAYGHSFGAWYLAVRPTQDAEGRWERICSVCDYVDTEPTPAVTEATQTPAATYNLDRQNYSVYGSPVTSYLIDNRDGTLTRVETADSGITVERYDAEYQFLSRQVLPMELPLFGGFYEGTDYFFLAFGQANPEEDDGVEVIRVVRYTKDWLRLGQASLYGANTYIPFEFGSLRMTQYQDMLYVHTCHEMYATGDGYHHQANLIFSISIPEMEITDQFSAVGNVGYGYVSHSFNQFVLTDGDKLLTLNHGDAYPRSAVIVQYGKPAGQEIFSGSCTYTNLLKFTGSTGYNPTGASLGAFELSDSAYLTAGNSIVQDGSVSFSGQRNIFLCVTPRGDIGSTDTTLHWITSYDSDADIEISTPHLVPIQGDRFLLLWTEDDLLHYVFMDDMGNTVSEIYKANLLLSDCKPIVWNNAVCWYVTQNSKPAFFSIPLDHPDAPENHAPKITITLDPSGGTLESSALTFTRTFAQPYGELPVPQRKSGYRFLGWYRYQQYYGNTSTSGQITADTIVTLMNDHTLYAHWEALPHDCEYEVTEVIPANCTSGEIAVYTCIYCDNFYRVQSGVVSHTWDDGTITTQPTCTEWGETVFRCTLCDTEKTEYLPPTGHSYTGTVTPPTCTAQGYTTHTCTACGNSYQDTYTAALGHDWNAGTVTTTPTCTQKGEKLFRCRRCEATKTESLPAKGHSYTETVTPPTCTEQGYTTYACHCGYSYQGGYVSGLGHDFGEWVTTQEPTCTEAGTAVRACTRCSEKLTIPIEALGHNEQIVVTEPTCTTQGYNTHTCIRCQESYQDRFTDPLGHLWNGGEITKAPTATERGEKTYTCERCAETRTESIPATGEQAETSCDGGKNCPSAKFRDVSAKEWYHLYVDYVVAHGLFGGTSNTTFEPETAMTRAMLVTLLWRYEGNPAEGENTFTDVPEGTWYTEAVAWAAANGVVNGVGSNRFDPEGELTREQMAALLFRYAQQKGIDTSERGSLLSFLDGGRVSSWAEDAIQWTVAEGIIAGSDGCLLPQGNATRAQVAAILTRFIENIVKSE